MSAQHCGRSAHLFTLCVNHYLAASRSEAPIEEPRFPNEDVRGGHGVEVDLVELGVTDPDRGQVLTVLRLSTLNVEGDHVGIEAHLVSGAPSRFTS